MPKLANAVGVRDQILKTMMLEAVQPILSNRQDREVFAANLDSMFEKASEEWQHSLSVELGESTALNVLHIMQRAV